MPLPLPVRDPLLFPIVGCGSQGQIATISESLLGFGGFLRVTQDRWIVWDHVNFCKVSTVGDITIPLPGSGRMLIRDRRWELL